MPAVVLPRADLRFPGSLPEFQRLFPDDTACAAYLEAIRWRDGFVCKWCGEASEPYRFANRPQVLRCRKCQRDNALTAGTVMERTRTPLSIWFWAAYLVSSHTRTTCSDSLPQVDAAGTSNSTNVRLTRQKS